MQCSALVSRTVSAFALSLLLVAGEGCTVPSPAPASAGTAGTAPGAVAFTDVTAAAGLGDFRHETGAFGQKWMPEWMGSGGAFLDYDGDGWLDVLLAGGGTLQDGKRARALWLYRNDGDGTFSLRTAEAGLDGVAAYALGLSVADYDNDGDQDFFLSTLHRDLLFRNDGGTFTEVGRAAGLTASFWSSSALFFDADRDGWLDLYVGGYVDWSPERDIRCSVDGREKGYCTPELYEGVAGRFYRNNGDGTFTDRTEAAGFLPAPGKTLGVAELDFNDDGWPDLAVANDMQRDLLYENDGDGTFTEQGMLSGIAFDEHGRARAGMGIDAGDVHGDGEPSIFIGNFSNEMIGMYRHIGDDFFVDEAARAGIGQPSLLTLTFGLFLFDVDLDGDLDLFAANGHMQDHIERIQDGIAYRQPPQLFLNRGDGTFEEVRPPAGSVLARPLVARGAAWGDVDRDGDLDVLLTENGGPAHLWRNDLQGGNFLRVRLAGRQSNADAAGAQVVAVVGQRRLERRLRTGSSYLSQSERAAHFGLGGADHVDSLRVHWPGGRVDRFGRIPANQDVFITEGMGRLDLQAVPRGDALASGSPRP